MLKFAAADVKILDSVLVPRDANRSARRALKVAHRHHFDYTPRAGYLYVRSRAISSRCNDNYDEFPAEEIAKAYKTFVGKPVFVNHHNDDHRQMRGVIIDAALHRDTLPGGAPDTWCEVLMEVDAIRFPKLASEIIDGNIDRTSMGCDVAYSLCSVCANKATSPAEYCQHIPRMKGQRVYKIVDRKTGRREGVLVREICYGLRFFENSLLVEEPADPTAYFLGVDTSGLDKAASKTAMRDQATCPHDGSWNLHGQCTQCGYTPPTESDEECDHPYCQENGFPEGWHTKGEHIDPPHLDPNSDEYRESQRAVDDAFGDDRHLGEQLLGGQPTGPTKWSSLQAMAAQFTAAGVPFDEHKRRQIIDQAKEHVRLLSGTARMLGHEPMARNVNGNIDIFCKHCFDSTLLSHRGGKFVIEGPMHKNPCQFNPSSPAFTDQQAPPGEPVSSKGFGPDQWLKPSLNSLMQVFAMEESEDGSFSIPIDQDEMRAYRDAGEMRREMHEHGQKREVNLADPVDLKAHLAEAHEFYPGDYWRNSHDQDHEALDEGSNDDRPLRHGELKRLHEHDHHHYPGDYPGVIVGDSHFHSASKQAKAEKPVHQMTPEEYEAHKAKTAKDKEDGERWNRRHPVKIKNIVDHWHAATDDEVHTGMNWYSDAHHLSRHIANDTGTDMTTMAGLMSNYSPQTHWAANIHTAARVARTKTAVGGPGEGVMASKTQKKAAQRMLDGEHYDKVLSGPKTRAFAHLIEHGDNAEGSEHKHVVVDRHALSVAAGARATDAAYSHSKLGTKGRYDHVSDAYRKAAKQISKHVGHEVHPHQVQAVTWIVRQRLNEQEDRANSKSNGARSASAAQRALKHWEEYAGEHHPGALGMVPGTGYSSAPDDIKHSHDLADEGKITTHAGGGTNDTMVTCDQGHEHWGAEGAAGLLLRHRGHDGEARYLLQKRGPGVDSPNTYSIPGGAIAKGESPVRAAIRESREEMGAVPNFRVSGTHVNDHGGWAYHTIVADVDHQFDDQGGEDGHEQAGLGWYTPDQIDTLNLHPGFKASWEDLKMRSAPMDKQAIGPMGGAPKEQDDSPMREYDWCKTCGGKIFHVADGSPQKYAWQHDIEQGAGVPHQAVPAGKISSLHTAYGDTKAPADVDTLRESECPVCGNDDSWDGDRCMVCGFFRPPQMFMDPDTSIAGQMDLRQDVADQTGGPDPTMGQDGETIGAAPSQTDAGGGGMTLNPLDPSQVSEDGMVAGQDPNAPSDVMLNTDQADPNGLAAADMQQAADDALMPQQIGPDGVDMGAADKHFNQGGEAFTQGPNAPTPEQPMDPDEVAEDGTDPLAAEQAPEEDGQQPGPVSDGEPGTPGDGVPDLVCPACGFQADGASPLSMGDSAEDPTAEPNGAMEGDACPQCGKAPLTPISQVMVG